MGGGAPLVCWVSSDSLSPTSLEYNISGSPLGLPGGNLNLLCQVPELGHFSQLLFQPLSFPVVQAGASISVSPALYQGDFLGFPSQIDKWVPKALRGRQGLGTVEWWPWGRTGMVVVLGGGWLRSWSGSTIGLTTLCHLVGHRWQATHLQHEYVISHLEGRGFAQCCPHTIFLVFF